MLTLILIIAVGVWAWNKYKKTPTVYAGFFTHNKWIKWNIIGQIGLSLFVAIGAAMFLSQGTAFLMHDWVGDIANIFGLGDLYGVYQEYGDDSDRMGAISDAISPLLRATMLSSVCAFVVIVMSLYTLINIKQKKFDEGRYYTLAVIGAIAIIIVSYISSSDMAKFQSDLFGGDDSSTLSAIFSTLPIAAILIFLLVKFKKNLTQLFDETDEEIAEINANATPSVASAVYNTVNNQVATASEPTKQCPYCGETILAVAKKCKHCGEWLPEEKVEEQIEVKIIQCPICGEDIEEGTEICPYCKERVSEYIDKSEE